MPKGAGHGYGGVPALERTQARRARLLEAALDYMGEGSWRSATVADLCGRAGLHKRYFYESFTDLDQVARAAIDHVADLVATAALDAYMSVAASEPLDQRARVTLGAIIRLLIEDPRKAQTLFGPVTASLEASEHRTRAVEGLTAILVEHARAIHDVRLEADSLAFVTPAFLIGGTGEAILTWLRNPQGWSIDQLIDDVTTLWLLAGDGAAEAARGRLKLGSATVEPQ